VSLTAEVLSVEPKSWVYRLWDEDGTCLYVGQYVGFHPAVRVADHRSGKSWWSEVATIDYVELDVGEDLDAAERAQIKELRPKYNVQHRTTDWTERMEHLSDRHEDLHGLTRENYLALPNDEKPHLYPDRPPSNSTYTGSKNVPGCRCSRCRAEHSRYVREKRQVIRVEPESVTEQPIPVQAPEDKPQPVAEGQTAPADIPAYPQPDQAVYSLPDGPSTADEVAADVLKRAVNAVGPNGVLPQWMIMAGEIASMYGVPVPVAKQAVSNNGQYIRINHYLNGGRGGVALIKRPVR
jgi:hypothetical protein